MISIPTDPLGLETPAFLPHVRQGFREPINRVVVLEDTNGDVMDKRTVFADGFRIPRA
jgi:hypothetical protein